MSDDIPLSIRSFLDEHIHSIGSLELLLWLWSHADQEWDAVALSAKLSSSPTGLIVQLEEFRAKKILLFRAGPKNVYQFNKKMNQVDAALTQISQYFADRRHKIIEYIYSSSAKSIQSFANAFKIRKDKNNG